MAYPTESTTSLTYEGFPHAENASTHEMSHNELSRIIRTVVRRYQQLSEREREHQRMRGASYVDASQQLTDETMTIS